MDISSLELGWASDLIFTRTKNTGTGGVEVHVASGASQYDTSIWERPTTFLLEADWI